MNNDKITIEVAIIIIILVISYFFFSSFDILEKIVAWSHKYEKYEIDEMLSISIVLVVLLLYFSIKRLSELNKSQNLLKIQNKKLQKAMDEIKQLKGILPLCSFCKKIRNDSGYWEQVDRYIMSYSSAEISHSICPDCLQKHYPDEYALIYSEKD